MSPAEIRQPQTPDSRKGKRAWASVSISEIYRRDHRLDGEAYLTAGYAIRHALETVRCASLAALTAIVLPARLKAVEVDPEHGVPFLMATQVFDIRPAARKFLAAGKTPALETRFVTDNQILVTRSGSVGDTILAYAPHREAVISDDLMRLTSKKDSDYAFLYGFLNTRHARSMMRSNRYGSIIKHLQPSHLSDIPVPIPPSALKRRVTRMVREAYERRNRAYELRIEAEQRYLEEIGDVEQPHKSGFLSSSATLRGGRRRLDAQYHNPRAAAILDALKRAGTASVALEQVTEEVFGVPRFKHVYQASGIPYVDSEDLFKINPELTKFIPLGAKRNAPKYFVKAEWLLMACSGQIYGLNGSVVLAGKWHENKIISNHVIRIVPNDTVHPGYLAVVLGHPQLGRPCVIRCAFGSEVPEIAPEDLLSFPVPRFHDKVEADIGDRMRESLRLSEQADELENRSAMLIEGWLSEIVQLNLEELISP